MLVEITFDRLVIREKRRAPRRRRKGNLPGDVWPLTSSLDDNFLITRKESPSRDAVHRNVKKLVIDKLLICIAIDVRALINAYFTLSLSLSLSQFVFASSYFLTNRASGLASEWKLRAVHSCFSELLERR